MLQRTKNFIFLHFSVIAVQNNNSIIGSYQRFINAASAKAARMLAGGIYDKYSADQRTEIERIADIYLLDFRQAPIPHKEV